MKVQTCAAILSAILLASPAAHAQDAAAPAAPATPAAADSAPPATTEAPAASAAPAAPAAAEAPAAAPATANAGLIGEPPAGKGQIVFFRPIGPGIAIGCGVHENGAKISGLGFSKYFVLPADPGTHKYMVESEAKDVLTLEVESGETYYVKCSIGMGLIVGRPNLSPSDKAAFDKKSKGLKRIVLS